MYSKIVIFILLFISLFSCKKQPIGEQSIDESSENIEKNGNGLFIVCEGNFGWQNGTLSLLNLVTNQISNDVFKSINSRPLGDIPQSITIIESSAYIIVNNSHKIEIINTNNLKSTGTITGLNSPRYMLKVGSSKAYISSYKDNFITVLNTQTNQVSGTVQVGCITEKLIKYNNFVFAAHWSHGNKILVINSLSDQVVDTIITVKEPNSLEIDKNNKLWVLCSGGYENHEPAALKKINTSNFLVEQTLLFPSTDYPTKLCINKTKDTLYFLNNGIFKMSITDSNIPATAFVNSGNRNFYGLAYDSLHCNLWVSNTFKFTQPGYIYRYRLQGIVVDSFKVDTNPGEFCFY